MRLIWRWGQHGLARPLATQCTRLQTMHTMHARSASYPNSLYALQHDDLAGIAARTFCSL